MSLRFPAVRIGTQAEFDAWYKTQRPLFDQRWLYEQQQIKAGCSAEREGTCGLCLAPTRFHSPAPDAQRNWREELHCGCALGLSHRQRAVLHFLAARTGIHPGQQVTLIGAPSAMETKLAEWGMEPRGCGGLAPRGRLDLPDGSADPLICSDYAQHVPPLLAFFRELARVMRPGGTLVLTVPFDVHSATTKSRSLDLPALALDSAEALHLFGWDLLDLLRDLGFAEAAGHFYWSDEMGYLGAFNMMVSAVKL